MVIFDTTWLAEDTVGEVIDVVITTLFDEVNSLLLAGEDAD